MILNGSIARFRTPASRGRLPRLGFTLVEILIAVAILAGILAAIYSSWMAVLRATQTAQRAAADVQRSRLAVRCLEEALTSVQMFPLNAPLYAFVADTTEEHPALSFVARLPESFPRSGHFNGKSMRRVEFTVEPDEQGVPTLMLRQIPLLFETDPQETENPLRLARNVRLFYLEFWGPNAEEWEDEWLSTNQLPRLVRFSLAMAPDGEQTVNRQDVVSRVVLLPLTSESEQVAGMVLPQNQPRAVPRNVPQTAAPQQPTLSRPGTRGRGR